MFDCVAIYLEILLVRGVGIEGWVVGFPVDKGVVRGEGKWGSVEGVDMGAHTVLCAFGHDSFDFNLFVVGFLSLFVMLLVIALGVVTLHD
jgi:hypothetical protein